jgi:hypothetical protein
MLMRWNYLGLAACCAAAGLAASPAVASDLATDALMRTFSSACLPNAGNPAGVRAWAKANRLTELHDAESLTMFEGVGGLGDAWVVPTRDGTLWLAVRGRTLDCAVFAQAADPAEVEASVKRLVDAASGPDLKAVVTADVRTPTAFGEEHDLIYHMVAPGASQGPEYLVITLERAGGPFQAVVERGEWPQKDHTKDAQPVK